MTVAKYWGDERHEDALYSVYLKKVRYVPPPGLEPASRQARPDADLLQWETIRERVIKAGSLPRLVDCLLGADEKLDSRHFNVFFATFRAFCKPLQVVEQLLARCDRPGASAQLLGSVRSVFVCWMDMYAEDFYEADGRFAALGRLIEQCKSRGWAELKLKARKLRDRFRRVQAEGGLAAQLPCIEQYTYALDYDPNDMLFAREHAQMFDVSKDNCVQIAEQLTFWDAILFRELRPYQCQGAIWGKRHKEQDEDLVYSVKATINQRVMTSIVLPECRPEFRARIIEKWIEVARELKTFKNYSSLKAVLSSLQAEPVHRIKSAWGCVSKSALLLFRDLAATFDSDALEDSPEGPGLQYVSEVDPRLTHLQQGSGKERRGPTVQPCRRTKSDVNLADSQGVVPYLGNFLTDLTMIDQAYPDLVHGSLINFEKRRREFEVIAKIRLFQSAARAYTVPMDQAFCAWFYYLPRLDENDCFQRSQEVEPRVGGDSGRDRAAQPGPGRLPGTPKPSSFSRILGHLSDELAGRTALLGGQHASNDSGIVTEESWTSSPSSTPHKELSSEFSPPAAGGSGRRDRVGRAGSPSSADGLSRRVPGQHSTSSHASSTSSGSAFSGTATPRFSARPVAGTNLNFYLARVGLDDQLQRNGSAEGANYKCIKVENGDRLGTLVERALEKHLLEQQDPDDFCLVQLLPDGGEFRLPDHCNPFYAVAPDPSSPMLNFLLKRKEDGPGHVAMAPSAKKLNRQKRSNLLRWSSGYL